MCDIVNVKGRGIQIKYIYELTLYFGIPMADMIKDPAYERIMPSECLCQIDIPETLRRNGIGFRSNDMGEYEVRLKESAMRAVAFAVMAKSVDNIRESFKRAWFYACDMEYKGSWYHGISTA